MFRPRHQESYTMRMNSGYNDARIIQKLILSRTMPYYHIGGWAEWWHFADNKRQNAFFRPKVLFVKILLKLNTKHPGWDGEFNSGDHYDNNFTRAHSISEA